MSNKEKIKTTLVGFGKSASIYHLPIIEFIDDFELVSVVSSNKDKVKSRLPNVTVFNSLEELLSKSDTDLVIITTPNHLHYTQAKQSILARKHVIIEKPFVLDVEHGKELINLSNKHKVKLSIYHNRRWDSGFLTLQRLIKENRLGEINLYESRFDRYRPQIADNWKEKDDIDGSGILWDLAPHLIDQALLLFGKPNEVFSDVAIQRTNGKSIDYFHIIFKYTNLRVIIRSSSLSHKKTPHTTVQGENCTFVRYELDPQENALKNGYSPNWNKWGIDETENTFIYENKNNEILKTKITTEKGCYENFYILMAKAIKEDLPVPVSPEDALEVIKTINLIENNSNTNTIIHRGSLNKILQ